MSPLVPVLLLVLAAPESPPPATTTALSDRDALAELNCLSGLGFIDREQRSALYELFASAEQRTVLAEKLAALGKGWAPASFTSYEVASEATEDPLAGVGSSDDMFQWLGTTLHTMREPSLRTATRETFRVFVFRAFDLPISVRVESTPAGFTLTGKMASRPSRAGMLCARTDRSVSKKEVDALRACFSHQEMWTTDFDARNAAIRDGSFWAVETVKAGHYRIGMLRSPEDGALYDCGMMLLRMSGLHLGELY